MRKKKQKPKSPEVASPSNGSVSNTPSKVPPPIPTTAAPVTIIPKAALKPPSSPAPATPPATSPPAGASPVDSPSATEPKKHKEKKNEIIQALPSWSNRKNMFEAKAAEVEKPPPVESAVQRGTRKSIRGLSGMFEPPTEAEKQHISEEPAAVRSAGLQGRLGIFTNAAAAEAALVAEEKDQNARKGQKPKTWGASSALKLTAKTETCEACGKTVYLTEKITADEKIFHKMCLKCVHCGCVLGLGNYAGLKGKIYCKPHFKQLFKSKGNYNEGFGEEKLTTKWTSENKQGSPSENKQGSPS